MCGGVLCRLEHLAYLLVVCIPRRSSLGTVFESPFRTCYSLLRGRARYVIMTANLGGQYGEAQKLLSKPFCGVGAWSLVTSRSRIKSKQASACRPLVVFRVVEDQA